MTPFNKLTFVLGNTAAILVALFIAFYRDLERPYWAMFSVFIVAKPVAGAVRSKAFYRLMGTLIGASVSVFLIPPLVQAPVLLSTAVAAWVGICVYAATLDRTPRNYIPTLAGYSATIIGLSVVQNPLDIFNTAVARVEEISLGIICGAVAHSVFFPKTTADELGARLHKAMKEMAEWISEALHAPEAASQANVVARLSALVQGLHTAYTYVPFETSDVNRTGKKLRALQFRISALLPRVSAIQAGVGALRIDTGLGEAVADHLDRCEKLAHQIGADTDIQVLGNELAQIESRTPAFPSAPWVDQLAQATVIAANDLLEGLLDCRRLIASINNRSVALPKALRDDVEKATDGVFHVDCGIAALSGGAAAAAVLFTCAIWIQAAWPEGGVAVQFAAIGCSLFAMLDNPSKPITAAVIGLLVALPFGALYEFAILPRVDGFVSLALVLSPVLALFSYMMTVPKLAGAALITAIAFSGSLALQSTYQADFATFLNANSAEVVGLSLAAVITVIFRTVDPLWNAVRISRAGWREVQQAAQRRRGIQGSAWTMRMFDRLGLVSSRLAGAEHQHSHAIASIDGLKDLRVSLSVASLIAALDRCEPDERGRVEHVLDDVAGLYLAKSAGPTPQQRNRLAGSIDQALARLPQPQTANVRSPLLPALVWLRFDLIGHDRVPLSSALS